MLRPIPRLRTASSPEVLDDVGLYTDPPTRYAGANLLGLLASAANKNVKMKIGDREPFTLAPEALAPLEASSRILLRLGELMEAERNAHRHP